MSNMLEDIKDILKKAENGELEGDIRSLLQEAWVRGYVQAQHEGDAAVGSAHAVY